MFEFCDFPLPFTLLCRYLEKKRKKNWPSITFSWLPVLLALIFIWEGIKQSWGGSVSLDHGLHLFEFKNHSSIPCFTRFWCIIPIVSFLFTQSEADTEDTVTQPSNWRKNAFCFQILKTFLNSWTKQTYNVLNAKINYIPEILLGEISSHNALPFLQNH